MSWPGGNPKPSGAFKSKQILNQTKGVFMGKTVTKITSLDDLDNLPDEIKREILKQMRGVPDNIYINIFISAMAKALFNLNIYDASVNKDYLIIGPLAANIAMNYYREEDAPICPGFINKSDSLMDALMVGLEILMRFKNEGLECAGKITHSEKCDVLMCVMTSMADNMLINDSEISMYRNALYELMHDISANMIQKDRPEHINSLMRSLSKGLLQYLANASYEIVKQTWLSSDVAINYISAELTDNIASDIQKLSHEHAEKCVLDFCKGIDYADSKIINQTIERVERCLVAVCMDKHNYPVYLKIAARTAELKSELADIISGTLTQAQYASVIAETGLLVKSFAEINENAVKETCSDLLMLKFEDDLKNDKYKTQERSKNVKLKLSCDELFLSSIAAAEIERRDTVKKVIKKVKINFMNGAANV